MEDYETIAIILLLLFVFVWFTLFYDNVLLKSFNDFVSYLRECYSSYLLEGSICLPKYNIPMYTPVAKSGCGTPCGTPCGTLCGTPCGCGSSTPTSSCGSSGNGQNVINITCGGSAPSPCTPTPTTPCIPKPGCHSQTEVSLNGFRYILDILPGFIYKYRLDTSGNIIEESREVITHNFGILKKISVNAGKIVVEDSYSIEHVALVNSVTGMLTF